MSKKTKVMDTPVQANDGTPGGRGKKAKNPMKTLGRLIRFTFFTNYKVAGIFMVLCVIFAAVCNALGSAMLAPIITELTKGLNADLTYILWCILIVGCIYAIGAGSTFAYNRIMMYIAQGTLRNLRIKMFHKMQTLPLKYFDNTTHGDIMSMYTNDVDTMRQLLSQTVPQMVSAIVTVIALLIMMIIYSFTLTCVILVMVAVMILIIRYVGSRSARNFLLQQRVMGELNGFVEEMTEGQKVIKVFCHEEDAKADFKKINDEMYEASTRAHIYSFILGPINNNLGYVEYVLVAIVGIVLIATGHMGALLSSYANWNGVSVAVCAGLLVSFLAYSRQFMNPIQQVSMQFNSIVMGLAGAERIFEMVDTESEDQGGDITLSYGEHEEGRYAWKKPMPDGTYEYTPLMGDIRFNDVMFGYVPEKVILKHITLYAKPGQEIAFVGATGAGKTTITNLINRFYDIQSGSITYDGIPIRDINKADLRRSLGVVLQDTHLFTGTIMENIRYGRPDATDDECIQAAVNANADMFIRHLPEGYDTEITGDGANLSQGQRQLLSIARAMVTHCPVLILDEATSSIDTRTEKLIVQALDNLMRGRTVFVIAHRLSTVRGAHAIMVLDHGVIIERGSHEQLIAQKGTYYQLYTGAFELD
ncbi:MAG: ABC transporter ATP-binding protein/permease [Clostridia bacterium]|nr:ABC transporter ATP-binding protein/permease [Clostridia bacterium]